MPLVQSGVGYKQRFVFIDAPGHPILRRVNRTLGTYASDGRRYEVCPMCSAQASLRTEIEDGLGRVVDTTWKCGNCGYSDSDKFGPLN